MADPLLAKPQKPRRGRRISMRWWLGAAFALVGSLTAASVFLFVSDSSEDVIEERAQEIAVGRTVRVAQRLSSASPALTHELLGRNRAEGFAAWAFDREGNLVTAEEASGVSLENVPRRRDAVRSALSGAVPFTASVGGNVTVVGVRIVRRGRTDGAVLARQERPESLQGSLDQLRSDALAALAIAAGLGLLIGLGSAALITRRIRRLAESAGELAVGHFDTPVADVWSDELGDLALSLDSMRESLRESFTVLSSERDRLSAIFEGLDDAVIVVGYDGSLRFHNQAAQGLIADDVPAPEIQSLLRRAAQRGFAETDALRIGERVYGVHARDLPAESSVLCVVRDRTDELQRELAEREFVSNAAHELRNPIAGISSAVEVLQSGAKDDPSARERFIERLSDDAERLRRIIQALLTLARVERVDEGEVGVIDVRLACDDAAAASPSPEGVELEIDIESDLTSEGDPVLLRQVLIGLLSNAYKHTDPPGRVSLRARRLGDQVLIEVEDTGSGIPADEVSRVFERFYRGRGAREVDGFGLGLAIAKRMVDVMHGDIGVRSTLGRGSTFWVRLPVPESTPTPVA